MKRRHPVLALTLAATLAFGPVGAAVAYENNQSGAALGGGAHRKVNQMAGALFIKEIVKGENGAAFKRYDFQPLAQADKYKVLALNADVPAELTANLFKTAGITTAARMNWRDAEYDAAQKTVTFKFSSWVIEGGFTADEPERFMSLRHFFNPADGLGPAYLTDIPKGTGWAVMGSNPEIDAVTWATTHPDNQYAWTKGTEYLAAALSAGTLAEAQLNYAAAWRSLGETMHLAADMSVPAHVRNDSHPGDWRGAAILDDLRADAYEYLTNWGGEIERGWSSRQVDPDLLAGIRASATPDALLTSVASWVNRNFYSTDTIAYRDDDGNLTALNLGLNNTVLYTSPSLDDMTLDPKTGNIMGTDTMGNPIIMAHSSWLNANGWNSYPGIVNLDTVESQAQRLVPAAVWGAERLMELFMPLVEMEVASVEVDEDTDAPLITGNIGVRPAKQGGGYADEPSADLMDETEQAVMLFVRLTNRDGGTEERVYVAPPTMVSGGEFEISLADCTNADGLRDIVFPEEGAKPAYTKIEYGVGLDMGGVLVRSDYYSNEGIVGTWDVETTFDEVIIPPELLDTSGMSEEEARLYIESIKAAYGGGLLGQTFQSTAEIVANGADYILTPQYDESTTAMMAAAGYTLDMATTLKGNTMRATSSMNLGGGSTSNVIETEVSADRTSMDGTFETKMIIPTGEGSITVAYKGTWKGTKRD